MAYPRRVTEAYVTSDGTFFEREDDARRYEDKRRVRIAIIEAEKASRYHKFGEYVSRTDDGYVDNLVRELTEAGLRFA